MKLIDNWQSVILKSYCANALHISTAIPLAYTAMPDAYRALVPLWAVAVSAVIVWVSGIVGRVVQQPSVSGDQNDAAQ
jgi:hypothetical protein